ncbi:hypothetical protein ACKWTF_010371 [Chironomus riparius]
MFLECVPLRQINLSSYEDYLNINDKNVNTTKYKIRILLCRLRIYNIFIGISIYSKFSSHFQYSFSVSLTQHACHLEIGFIKKKKFEFYFCFQPEKKILMHKKNLFFLLHHTTHKKKLWLIIMAPKSIKSTFQYVTKISREDPGLIRRILVDDFFGAIIFIAFWV